MPKTFKYEGEHIEVYEPEPPTQLFTELHAFLGRFVVYPSEDARIAHTLWIGHAHLMDAWESTPRIAFLSPEAKSGKTRALEITELLVPRPIMAVNVSPAALFRMVGSEKGLPTILFDEIDTVFGPKAKENEELRGLLNAGHRRGAKTYRCVVLGKKVKIEEIPAYCAVALAGIGDLPETILTRSVIVRMRRRAPGEQIKPFRRRLYEKEGTTIRDRLATWAQGVLAQATDAWPEMPHGIEDRDADVWEPLLTVAELVRGTWPQKARVAAVALVALLKESTPSLGVQLLHDLQDILTEQNERRSTAVILKALHEKAESPWADIRGKPLTDRGLANRLRTYGIKSKDLRFKQGDANAAGLTFAVGETEKVVKGYERGDFLDAWKRYPGAPPDGSATSATSATGSAP